ncbi:sacsin N-terminal ATP-binding-like domain-containing protein [Myroides odoratimimus]|uniref:sacsin N-terminal ATP-binding-like domain-containing protein n=1 Tax=Myroides odoratimimus TaxID=76832 RepID=UPI0029C04FA8|nr:ATP-binding protein [Myroides odoratimimus]MDX4972147.1 ATP-binding protein [Myroides odoratimimus]
MSALSIEGITEEIKTRTATYRNDPPILLSGYNQEKQTVQDYEGRQLLELMQNADDAKSDILRIRLDTANGKLSVQNNGDAFSLEGIKSLMFTGNSSKNKEEFIGNKGLGFRSILKWVHSVSIYTQTVSFRFSESHSQAYYQEHIASSEKVRQMIHDEVKANKLQADELPIAALAFPEIIDNLNDQDTVTNIVLDIKTEEIDAIKKQILEIREEVLLLLPHIKRLIVEIDGEKKIDFEKTKEKENIISINDSQWNIYRSETKTWNDGKKDHKYKFAIVWKDDLQTNGMFYNYFPTDVATHLPCIIHATFDLTNNRKEINETNANKHILEEIVKSLGEIADGRLKKANTDWQAYEFLTATSTKNRDVLEKFYTDLSKIKETVKVYPSVDNQYLLQDELIYHGEEFSVWVMENGFENEFTQLVLPIEERRLSFARRYDVNEFYNSISQIKESLDLNQRVALLGILAKNERGYFNDLHMSSILLPLLTNKNEQIVSEKIKVFTKNTEGEELFFPDYINDIEFISAELFIKLRTDFKDDIQNKKLDTESGDARAVKRFLEPIVNIGLDDITGVIEHIISETKKKISVDNDVETVKKMVQSLFSIFKTNEDRKGNLSTIDKIPLLSRDGQIHHAENIYFGKEYHCGLDTELIFEGVFEDCQYLAPFDIFEIESNEESIVNFFTWLNVNHMTNYETISKNYERCQGDDFVNHVLLLQENYDNNVHKHYEVTSIVGLTEILKNPSFGLEKLIAWIVKDNKFMQALHADTEVFYTEYNRNRTAIYNKPSYLQYQIQKSEIIDNVIASSQLQGFENIKSIDVNDDLFQKLGLQDFEIQKAIHLLGIKSSINEIEPDKIYGLLKSNSLTSEGNSQFFYKLLYEYFKANEDTQLKGYTLNFEEITYYARQGGFGKNYELKPLDEVYYSDNKLLPQQLLNRYWFINLPKRIGENRVAQFFGVKLIKDVISHIQFEIQEKHSFEKNLADYINKLKPFLLAYRLNMLTKESDKKDAANILKQIQFSLVKKAKYKVGDDIFDFEDYDFIPKDNVVVLQYSKEVTLETLQKDSHFCDMIAEIISVIFKVADQNKTFRRIFKDGVKETLHILKSDEKEDILAEAQRLLGVSQQEISFWKGVFPNVNFDFDTDAEMQICIEKHAGCALPDEYQKVDFENWNHQDAITLLAWVQQNCNAILDQLITSKDIENWHLNNINNFVKDQLFRFEQLLWKQANESSDDELRKDFYKKARQFEDSKRIIFKELGLDKDINLSIDYLETTKQFAKDHFEVDLEEAVVENIDISPKYKELLSEYSFGDSVDDMLKLIKDQDSSVYSLMYFDDYQEQVKAICEEFQKENMERLGLELDEVEDENLAIYEGSITASGITFPTNRNGFNGGGSHTSKSNKQKAASGRKQEIRVQKSLEKNGYLVNPVSTKTDGKHYDLEYKRKGEIQWRYLEVKKNSGGFFYLSKDERLTALSKEVSDKYDVAIVDDSGIYIIKSMFDLNDESFDNNSKFTAEATEYKIHFKFNETE